jgi:CRISPR-associated endonuclease/helicase Cas3
MIEKHEQLLAHIRAKDKELQSLANHLQKVSELTGTFSDEIGLKEAGELLGLLHDFGKANNQFQNYLLSGEGFLNPDADGYIDPEANRGKIDHSTAGAQVIYEHLWNKGPKEKIAAQILALCISSHHSGLIDCLTPDGENNFKKRMGKIDEYTHKTQDISNLQDVMAVIDSSRFNEVPAQLFKKLKQLQTTGVDSQTTSVFKAGLLIRFLLSCLIDADRLDTADFESPNNKYIRNYGKYRSWKVLIKRLDIKLKEFGKKENQNSVDKLRTQVSQACLDYSKKPKGIYQLTVPTGGGKTLASLRFALNHADFHGMQKVFYIIPYTSIIDQNANEIRKILEDKDVYGHYLDQVVLEHHSNLTPDEETHRQNLLAQNWDAPIVLTTQVQFFEALFGSGTRSIRRMHQLANSVIILDEVQTIPIQSIHMLNLALRFLTENCGATVVLCTATQPPLDNISQPYRALTIHSDQRIIQNERELYRQLTRVRVYDRRKVAGWSVSEVADLSEKLLEEKGSVLIVVNTKKSAHLLYEMINGKKIAGLNLYHLSTNMCPTHRLEIIETIKQKLDHEPVICVSTQLIEAGVDIDFGAVIRYLAGLDSIAQSAGRCNRHGKRPSLGNVWIVNPEEENISKLKDIQIGADQTQWVLNDFKADPAIFGNDIISLDAIAAYYQHYYEIRKGDMSYKVDANSPIGHNDDLFNLLSLNTLSLSAYQLTNSIALDLPFRQSFQSAAKSFHAIDSPTRGVIVQYKQKNKKDGEKDGEELVNDLCGPYDLEKQFYLLKPAQRFSVNLFPEEFKRMSDKQAIHEVQPGTGVYYMDQEYYSDQFGWSEEIVNLMKFHCA